MYVKVFVTPDARKEKVEERAPAASGEGNETLLVSVKEPAEGNRANRRVRELLALRFQVPVAQVRILTGHRSRSKLISVSS